MNDTVGTLGYTLLATDDRTHDAPQGTVAREDGLADLRAKTEFILPVAVAVFIVMIWDIVARTTIGVPNLPIPMDLLDTIALILASVALFWVGQPYLLGWCGSCDMEWPIWTRSSASGHPSPISTAQSSRAAVCP